MLLNVITDLIFVINETKSNFCKLVIDYNMHISKLNFTYVCANTKNCDNC